MAPFERQYTSGHLFSSKKITRSFRYQSKIPENRRDEDIQCVQTSIGAYILNIPAFHAFPKPLPFDGSNVRLALKSLCTRHSSSSVSRQKGLHGQVPGYLNPARSHQKQADSVCAAPRQISRTITENNRERAPRTLRFRNASEIKKQKETRKMLPRRTVAAA